MSYVVVRLRGVADRSKDQRKTLESLRLHKIHHATIVPATPAYDGMLKHVEHLVTYGDLDADTAEDLLRERGRGPGDVAVDDAFVQEHTPYGSIEELAEALTDDDVDIGKLSPLKPVFRLSPATGGFAGKKRHFNEGGSLGYRGDEISDLIGRML